MREENVQRGKTETICLVDTKYSTKTSEGIKMKDRDRTVSKDWREGKMERGILQFLMYQTYGFYTVVAFKCIQRGSFWNYKVKCVYIG